MLLNRVEFILMNNPLRAVTQRHFEARRLLQMGGPCRGGRALEIGCGRGVGAGLILDLFEAATVDAFDLDPRMIARARKRLRGQQPRVRLWVGDAACIPVAAASYDAVFDVGIIHHLPDWRSALAEVHRVLRPGGRFYAEEVLRPFIVNPVVRRLLQHPVHDRFDCAGFVAALQDVGLTPLKSEEMGRAFAWFTATKAAAVSQA